MKKVAVIIIAVVIQFCVLMFLSRFVFRDDVTSIFAQATIVGIVSAVLIFLAQKTIRKIT